MTGKPAYAFHDADLTAVQLDYLQQCLDDNTKLQLRRAGLAPGWRCLEIGAGSGSIAGFLHRSTPDGYVLATDLRPERIQASCDTLRHDITTDPIPDAGSWSLIHARLVELHLPQRREIVANLAAALALGGVLLLESFDCRTPPALLRSPDGTDPTVWNRAIAAILLYLQTSGADLDWAQNCPTAMLDCGLSDVVAEMFNRTWAGGTPGTGLHAVNLAQLNGKLDSLTTDDVAEFETIAVHPQTLAWFHPMVSSRGVRR